MTPWDRPKLAVWKFASCDGCQLSLLDCEDELLDVAEAVTIAHFPEATRTRIRGPWDLSLVEGSITTPEAARQIRRIRDASRRLVTIGACATSGGIQALKNFADAGAWRSLVYAEPGWVDTLATSEPIADHVAVDFELRGCPIHKGQLLETIAAFLAGRTPNVRSHPVCVECKAAGIPCVMVARGVPCLGPVTHAGCGAICPSYARGCYGCFGPSETPNTRALADRWIGLGVEPVDVKRVFRTFNANAPAFREEADRMARAGEGGRDG